MTRLLVKYEYVAIPYIAEVGNDVFNSSMPPSTPHGAAFNLIDKIKGTFDEK
ncbi:MAG: hypothetical protein ACNI25_12200 [Halarcobacter sp.]